MTMTMLAGTVFFENGDAQSFAHVESLILTLRDGAERIPQNVTEWPLDYDPRSWSRSIPLRWVRSLEVRTYELKPGYRCLFEPEVVIENLNGARFRARYKTLEWIKVRLATNAAAASTIIYFNDFRRIRRIVFQSS